MRQNAKSMSSHFNSSVDALSKRKLTLRATGLGRLLVLIMFAFTGLQLAGCGIQSLPQGKNEVEATLAEVTNQYKRRADLVPNLVETVKGFAKQEESVLVGVTEARAKATSIQIDPSKTTPEQLAKYAGAQGELSQALGRLMMVSEKYPDLKSDAHYRDLMTQLEGTENRIVVARNRHIEAIKKFNDLITVPPTSFTNSLVYHFEKMTQWGSDQPQSIQEAPKVKF